MREYKDGILERIYCNMCGRRTDNLRTLSGLERQVQTEPFRETDWTYHYGSELYDFSGVKFDICEECVKVMEDDAVIPFENNDYDVTDELGFGEIVDLTDEDLMEVGEKLKRLRERNDGGIHWHELRKDEEDIIMGKKQTNTYDFIDGDSDIITVEEGKDNEYPVINYSPPYKNVGFKRLSDDAIIPTKAHATDSGYDLYAAKDVIIEPGETKVVPTNIAVELPVGCEAQVRPRSGVTAKTKMRVQLGTIDNGFKGDIGVIVDNISSDEWSNACRRIDNTYDESTRGHYNGYLIRKGDRIAQLVVQHLPQTTAVEIDEYSETSRGEGGFGSTGHN